jgi:RNA polymerase sigma-70 factor (ECF subfamily)
MSKQGIVYMETQKCRKLQDLEISDNELAHQSLVGNQDAFEALVSRYQHSLFRLIYRYVGEYHEAHDVLQQVWLQLYLSLPTLYPNVHVKPWLFTVARNRSLDVLRRRRLLTFSEVETGNEEDEGIFLNTIPDTSSTPEELVEQRDLQQAIQYAIQALPRTYRSVVLLYYKDQMNYAEIGQVLKMPVSTVKARFYRAKPFLRAVLTAQ